jgi:hypothetical protein
VVACALAGTLAACAGGRDRRPESLLDGSPARSVPVALEGLDGPAVLTRVEVVLPSRLGRGARTLSCLRERAGDLTPAGAAVERVGVSSETVTFRTSSGRAVFACDNSPGARESGRRWCGSSYGRVVAGRLNDPRLDLGCRTEDGRPLAFVWIEPAPETRYVAVEQPGYTEVYAVAAGLPVRVATASRVSLEETRATLLVSEHDRSGRLLRKYRLEAVVAG